MTTKEFIKQCCLALDVEPGLLDRNSSPETVETWDSLGYLSIIAMIDKEFGITIGGDELEKFKTLGDIIDELKTRGVLE